MAQELQTKIPAIHLDSHGITPPLRRSLELREGLTVGDLLRQLGLNGQHYAAAINGCISPVDATLSEGDEVIITRAITGG
jgi:sulfur carrier protein ThiS